MYFDSQMQPYSSPSSLCIIGAGGFGREVLCLYLDICRAQGLPSENTVIFAEADTHWTERSVLGIPVLPLSAVKDQACRFVIAIGDPAVRSRMAASMPLHTQWATLVHPTAVMSQWVSVGAGSIICAGVQLTCNISLGAHTQLNLNTTIGHDTTAGNYFTTAPGVAISGNCRFGEQVYIGSNACIRQQTTVTGHVVIGMGAVVIKDILQPGTWAGNPARPIS